MEHPKYIWLSIAVYMNTFDMFVCFNCYFYDWESFSFGILRRIDYVGSYCLLLLCSQRSVDLLHTYPLVGIRAFVARIYRDLWFVWFEGERNLLGKDETLCLRILKRMLRKSEQS